MRGLSSLIEVIEVTVHKDVLRSRLYARSRMSFVRLAKDPSRGMGKATLNYGKPPEKLVEAIDGLKDNIKLQMIVRGGDGNHRGRAAHWARARSP